MEEEKSIEEKPVQETEKKSYVWVWVLVVVVVASLIVGGYFLLNQEQP